MGDRDQMLERSIEINSIKKISKTAVSGGCTKSSKIDQSIPNIADPMQQIANKAKQPLKECFRRWNMQTVLGVWAQRQRAA